MASGNRKKIKGNEVEEMKKILLNATLEATKVTVGYIKNGIQELLKMEVPDKDSNGKKIKRHLNTNEFIHSFVVYLDQVEKKLVEESSKNV